MSIFIHLNTQFPKAATERDFSAVIKTLLHIIIAQTPIKDRPLCRYTEGGRFGNKCLYRHSESHPTHNPYALWHSSFGTTNSATQTSKFADSSSQTEQTYISTPIKSTQEPQSPQAVAPTGIAPSRLTSLSQPQPVTDQKTTTNAFAAVSHEDLSDDQAWDTVAKRRTHRRIPKKKDPESGTQQCKDCNVDFTLGNDLILLYVRKGLHVLFRCEACRTLNKHRNSQHSPSQPA